MIEVTGYDLWLISRRRLDGAGYVRHRAGHSGHLAKYYKAWPDQEGHYDQCACHPAPNPAARDYRRRTKHRNRRR